MSFQDFMLNETASKKNIKSFADIKDAFVGVPMGHSITIDGINLIINGMRGSKYIIDVISSGSVSDADGKDHYVDAGDKIEVGQDGLDLVVKEDSKTYSTFANAIEEVQERVGMMSMDGIKDRATFIKYIESIAELVSHRLPASRKKWK